MTDWIDRNCVQRTTLRLRRTALAAMLMASTALLSAATPARADDRVRVDGAFTVLYAYPSAINYCGDGASDDNASIHAQGLGDVPGLGPLFLTVKKCFTFSNGTYAGTFTMSSAAGDALHGTYEGLQGPLDANGFGPFRGVLTITGGSGKFRNSTGRLKFDATAGPDSVSAISSTYNGTAFYLVRGTVVSPGSR